MNIRAVLCTLLIGLAITPALTGCDSPEQKEARYIRRGNELLDAGEPEKARIEYKNALRIKPTDAEPVYRIGLVDESEGELRSAFDDFTAAEEQNSHYHPAVLKVAQYYMAADRYDEARKRIDAVLAEAPNDPEVHAMAAALDLRQNNFDAADKEARTALTEDPANISACAALTGLYSAEEDFDKAAATVNDGIARNPQSLPLMMLRVSLYQHMNDLTKTAEAYQAVFNLKPDETQYRVDLADIYVKAGKLDDAEAVLRAGVEARPEDWDLKHRLILFLGQYRGVDMAEKEIRQLIVANPDRDDLYFWLADLYASHDATEKAVALLNEIVARGQFDPPALNARTLLARIEIRRGSRALAQQLVATVLNKDPDNHTALYVRANMAFEDGNYENAVADLRSITRETPDDEDALHLLGETLLLQGHTDLAIDTMKKLGDLDPGNLDIHTRIAQMVALNGDPRQGMDIIDLVTKAAPNYAPGWETAARLAIDAKEWLAANEAIKQLDKLPDQHSTAVFLEGQVLAGAGNDGDAVTKYAEAASVDPTTPLAERAIKALVDTDRKLEHLDAAIAYLETLKVNSPFVLTMLGKCYAESGKMAESAAAFDKAIAAGPDFADPYLGRAELDVQNHKPEEAVDVLRKGAGAAPDDFRAPMREAELLGQLGRYTEAIALYNDMLARNPGLDAAANNLAEIIADYEFNDPAALENARRIAERFTGSTNPLLLDTLAWVYFRQGNMPLAQTTMERVLSLEPDDSMPPQMRFHYGMILMKEGRTDDAKNELRKVMVNGVSFPGFDEAKKVMDSQ